MDKTKWNAVSRLFVIAWALFTSALLLWWVIFSFRQLAKIEELDLSPHSQILKHQTMLIYEGITLFFCLLIGALALIYFIYKENQRLKERKDFLSVFTHDLKTTMTSLRLRLERMSHKDELSGLKKEALEVQKIGVRLNQQLQNALQFSYSEFNKAILEDVDLNKELSYLKSLWPDLDLIHNQKECFVKADVSLLRGVLSNIIQNAYDHSHCRSMEVKVHQLRGDRFIETRFVPLDGDTFEDSLENFIENPFLKKGRDSSGLGLKLSKNIMEIFGGDLSFYITEEKLLAVSLRFKTPKRSF